MSTIDKVANHLLACFSSRQEKLTVSKLHKLLYYCQAGHLANVGEPLFQVFQGRFQAWVHGPMNTELFYRVGKNIHSLLEPSDVQSYTVLSEKEIRHIQDVLNAYGTLTTTQLEDLSRSEEPWIQARGGIDLDEYCETNISEAQMRRFYVRFQVSRSSSSLAAADSSAISVAALHVEQ